MPWQYRSGHIFYETIWDRRHFPVTQRLVLVGVIGPASLHPAEIMLYNEDTHYVIYATVNRVGFFGDPEHPFRNLIPPRIPRSTQTEEHATAEEDSSSEEDSSDREGTVTHS